MRKQEWEAAQFQHPGCKITKVDIELGDGYWNWHLQSLHTLTLAVSTCIFLPSLDNKESRSGQAAYGIVPE